MLKQMLTVGAKDAVLLKVDYSKMIIHFASATSTIVRIQIRIDVHANVWIHEQHLFREF